MKRVIGQVINGQFVSGKPSETNNRTRLGHKEYVRLDMRDQYARDIEQRYKHGQVNEGYITAFGKQNAINEGLVEAPEYV